MKGHQPTKLGAGTLQPPTSGSGVSPVQPAPQTLMQRARLAYIQAEVRSVAQKIDIEDRIDWTNSAWPEQFSGYFFNWFLNRPNPIQMQNDLDMANFAFQQLNASHRSLTIARDENSAHIIELRDRVCELEALLEAKETS